jgi:hypothetical protein
VATGNGVRLYLIKDLESVKSGISQHRFDIALIEIHRVFQALDCDATRDFIHSMPSKSISNCKDRVFTDS